MKGLAHAFAGDRIQRIRLRTPSGLVLSVSYDQGIRQFYIHLIKQASPSQISRGKSSLIVLSHYGELDQLPSTPMHDGGKTHLCLGFMSIEVHPKSVQPLGEWLGNLNRLLHQATRSEAAQPVQGEAA